MKRFTFRLQKLWHLRRGVEGRRRQELGEALASQTRAEERASELAAVSRSERMELRRLSSAGEVDVGAVGRRRRYAGLVDLKLASARERVGLAEEEVKRRRESLLDARRQRRALDKLRERRWSQYLRAAERAEQQELDEAASRGAHGAEV